MATTTMSITIETSIFNKAISDLAFIHRALARCHGDGYRRLDRRIEHFVENVPSNFVQLCSIPGGQVRTGGRSEW